MKEKVFSWHHSLSFIICMRTVVDLDTILKRMEEECWCDSTCQTSLLCNRRMCASTGRKTQSHTLWLIQSKPPQTVILLSLEREKKKEVLQSWEMQELDCVASTQTLRICQGAKIRRGAFKRLKNYVGVLTDCGNGISHSSRCTVTYLHGNQECANCVSMWFPSTSLLIVGELTAHT